MFLAQISSISANRMPLLSALGFILLGTGAGYTWGGCENFSKDNWGYEVFSRDSYCCGMTSCSHFSIGYENFQQK